MMSADGPPEDYQSTGRLRSAARRPAAGTNSAPIDPRRLARIRWRARRGMLENDLVLTRFFDRRGADLCEAEVAALDRLLDLSDNELWELICGRGHADAALQPLLRELGTA